MRRSSLFTAAVLWLLVACNNRPTGNGEDLAAAKDTIQDQADTANIDFDNDLTKYPNAAGIAGLFNVRPMLALCRMDSSALDTLAGRVSYTYGVLAREAERFGVDVLQAGQLSYNNDPENFKFECVFLIDRIPGRRSDSSSAVLLEAASMVVFNHYGSYGSLHRAYEEIRNHCKASNLMVVGAMREFYITDPVSERDTSRWLTRILVPVVQKK